MMWWFKPIVLALRRLKRESQKITVTFGCHETIYQKIKSYEKGSH